MDKLEEIKDKDLFADEPESHVVLNGTDDPSAEKNSNGHMRGKSDNSIQDDDDDLLLSSPRNKTDTKFRGNKVANMPGVKFKGIGM